MKLVLILLGLIGASLVYLRIATGSFDPRGFQEIIDNFRDLSVKTTLSRNRKQGISRKKNKFVEFYYELVRSTLNNLEMSSTVEWFTFILIGLSVISFIIVFLMLQSVLVSLLAVLSAITVGVTALATVGKRKASVKLNAILDALDLLCAYIDRGVKNAVVENIGSFDLCIRPYFEEFLSELADNQKFDIAMDNLSSKLGPAFDSFAHKAKIYEKERLKGMDQLFKDIVDDNAVTREIAIKKDKVFGEMNESYMIKILIVVIFIVFSVLTNPGMKYFIFSTSAGKFITAISLMACSLVYAYTQLVQLDLTFGGGK